MQKLVNIGHKQSTREASMIECKCCKSLIGYARPETFSPKLKYPMKYERLSSMKCGIVVCAVLVLLPPLCATAR